MPAERLKVAAGLPEAVAPRPAGPGCRHPAEHHLAAAAPHRQRLEERPPAAVAARRRRPSGWAAGRTAAVAARRSWRLDPSSQEGGLAGAVALSERPCTAGLADLRPVPPTRHRRHRAAGSAAAPFRAARRAALCTELRGVAVARSAAHRAVPERRAPLRQAGARPAGPCLAGPRCPVARAGRPRGLRAGPCRAGPCRAVLRAARRAAAWLLVRRAGRQPPHLQVLRSPPRTSPCLAAPSRLAARHRVGGHPSSGASPERGRRPSRAALFCPPLSTARHPRHPLSLRTDRRARGPRARRPQPAARLALV